MITITGSASIAWTFTELRGVSALFVPSVGDEGTMETSKQPGPPSTSAWARKYLGFAAWTHDEFRNLLCGLPPHPLDDTPLPKTTPARTSKETADAFVLDELRRLDADRHVRDAIVAGHLKVLAPPDDQLLEKIAPHATAEDIEALRRAVVHERTCSKTYRFSPEAARRWAVSRRELFPDFALPMDDVPKSNDIRITEGKVSDELKRYRRTLIDQALDRLGVDVGQTEFFKKHGIGEDTVRGIVNGQTKRYGKDTKAQVLKLLGLSARDWNALP